MTKRSRGSCNKENYELSSKKRNAMKNQIFAALALVVASSQASFGQQALPLPAPAAKGETQNLSVTSGNRSTLTFGTSTNFGVSVSTQNSAGMTVMSRSELKPSLGTISSSVGVYGETPGRTIVNIGNLRAAGDAGSINLPKGAVDSNGNPIDADGGKLDLTGTVVRDSSGNVVMVPVLDSDGNPVKDNSNNVITQPMLTKNQATYAAGNALMDGLTSEVNLELDPNSTGFYTETSPNIVGNEQNPCGFGNYDPSACKYATKFGTKPGVYNPIMLNADGTTKMYDTGAKDDDGFAILAPMRWGSTSFMIDPVTGDPLLDAQGEFIPITSTEQAFGNGSANSSLTSNTNVDIQTSQFTTTFAQSF